MFHFGIPFRSQAFSDNFPSLYFFFFICQRQNGLPRIFPYVITTWFIGSFFECCFSKRWVCLCCFVSWSYEFELWVLVFLVLLCCCYDLIMAKIVWWICVILIELWRFRWKEKLWLRVNEFCSNIWRFCFYYWKSNGVELRGGNWDPIVEVKVFLSYTTGFSLVSMLNFWFFWCGVFGLLWFGLKSAFFKKYIMIMDFDSFTSMELELFLKLHGILLNP